MWYDVIADALLDTLKLFPFLLLLYILIELMEHNTRIGKPSRLLTGGAAPLVGTATGLVPMCGFSVMAAKLYEHRHITLGALFAVLVATSDEAVIVLVDEAIGLFASGEAGGGKLLISLAALLGSKFVLGVGIGYAVDLAMRFFGQKRPAPLPEHEHSHGEHAAAEEHGCGEHGCEEHEEDHEHGRCECDELTVCEHKKVSTLRLYLLSPLLHALQVAAFVLLVNLAFGFLFYGIGGGDSEAGERLVGGFMDGAGYWLQPVLCALVGLVPNCASSVVIVETYAIGGISFGGLLGGLVANTGLGCLTLFRGGVVRAILITAALFALGVAVGYATLGIELLF